MISIKRRPAVMRVSCASQSNRSGSPPPVQISCEKEIAVETTHYLTAGTPHRSRRAYPAPGSHLGCWTAKRLFPGARDEDNAVWEPSIAQHGIRSHVMFPFLATADVVVRRQDSRRCDRRSGKWLPHWFGNKAERRWTPITPSQPRYPCSRLSHAFFRNGTSP